jgi:Tfp pilus assembly protein PilX
MGNPGAPRRDDNRGVALAVTLLLLLLMSVLGLAAVLATSSDLMVNGYYANYRGAFYAADSGLNIARQDLLDNLLTQVVVPTGNNLPVPANAATVALNALMTQYGSSYYSINSSAAANSWRTSFQVVANSKCGSLTSPTQFQLSSSPPGQYGTYAYSYYLCVAGRALASQQVYVYETGQISIDVEQPGGSSNLSQYGTFVSNWPPCQTTGPSAGWLMPGVYEGPNFTNGSWTFGVTNYTFTGTVGQSGQYTGYWFSDGCVLGDSTTGTDTDNHTHQTISPTYQGSPPFQNSLNGAASEAPPQNSFSQKWAVLDGTGCGEPGNVACGDNSNQNAPSLPTQAQMHTTLMNVSVFSGAQSPTPYPDPNPSNTSVPNNSNGVYLAYSPTTETAGCLTPPCMTGGGIYVEGNASILLTPGTDSSGNNTQIYTITQVNGSTTATTTITTDVAANTTTVANSISITSHGNTTTTNASKIITGVPTATPLVASTTSPSCVASAGGNCAETMLYVDGNITGLTGPGEGQGAIQNGTQLSIVANGNINITGDVIYAHEPVTMDANDYLIPANDQNQVLGVFTSNGFINLNSPYSDHNLQTDGSLAAIGGTLTNPCNTCGFTTGNYVATWNNVGGQIQTSEYTADMSYANIYFDQRFGHKKGFVPPWFPATNTGSSGPMTTAPAVKRISWNIIPE